MAEKNIPVSNQAEVERERERLMFLEFVQKAAQHAIPYVSKAYVDPKDNSGPLKPSVETMEDAVDESVSKVNSSSVTTDIKDVGVEETAAGQVESTAKEVSEKHEPVVEEHAASGWFSLNKIPLLNTVAKVVTPTASYVSDKYNKTVKSSFLPLVPTEKIGRVFNTSEHEAEPKQEHEPAVHGEDKGDVVAR